MSSDRKKGTFTTKHSTGNRVIQSIPAPPPSLFRKLFEEVIEKQRASNLKKQTSRATSPAKRTEPPQIQYASTQPVQRKTFSATTNQKTDQQLITAIHQLRTGLNTEFRRHNNKLKELRGR